MFKIKYQSFKKKTRYRNIRDTGLLLNTNSSPQGAPEFLPSERGFPCHLHQVLLLCLLKIKLSDNKQFCLDLLYTLRVMK